MSTGFRSTSNCGTFFFFFFKFDYFGLRDETVGRSTPSVTWKEAVDFNGTTWKRVKENQLNSNPFPRFQNISKLPSVNWMGSKTENENEKKNPSTSSWRCLAAFLFVNKKKKEKKSQPTQLECCGTAPAPLSCYLLDVSRLQQSICIHHQPLGSSSDFIKPSDSLTITASSGRFNGPKWRMAFHQSEAAFRSTSVGNWRQSTRCCAA